MAVAVRTSTLSKTKSAASRAPSLQSVRLMTAGVIAALVAIAAVSGAWIPLVVVGTLFLLGTSLLASGDEPLSLRQVASIGAIHLVAGLLLAL